MSWFRAFGQRLILIINLLFSFGNAHLAAFQQPVGPLSGLFAVTVSYCASIHVNISTVAIKLASGFWGRPLAHLLLSHSGFTTFVLCVANTHCFLL
jgi:hypothetical protein